MKMTLKRTAAAIAAITMMLGSVVATAQDSNQPGAVGRVVETMNPTNWKMPQWKMPSIRGLLPAKEEKTRIIKKKDSLFDEVKQTASNSWRRTKETFNPQKLNPTRFFPASARTPSAPTAEEKPGFFGSLFAPPPQPERSATVTDFLGQAKPKG